MLSQKEVSILVSDITDEISEVAERCGKESADYLDITVIAQGQMVAFCKLRDSECEDQSLYSFMDGYSETQKQINDIESVYLLIGYTKEEMVDIP